MQEVSEQDSEINKLFLFMDKINIFPNRVKEKTKTEGVYLKR